jgi:predicted TPR repeat methyltransferase
MRSTEAGSHAELPEALTADEAFAYAMSLQRRGQAEHAAELYRRIIELEPDHVHALHYLGVASFQLGRSRDAIALIERALLLEPDNADAHNNLDNILKRAGELERARAEYERVLALRPGDPDALNNLGTLLSAKRLFREAAGSYREVIARSPEHVEAHHNLGNSLLALGEEHAALDAYQRALMLRPYDRNSYRKLGAAYYATGRMDEATAIYRRWFELQPNDPEAGHMLAACTGTDVPARASSELVKSIFDAFAQSFDEVLKRLEYKAPAVVAEAIRGALGEPRADRVVLDAGCGTGLGGAMLRPYASRLIGLDLSERMIQVALERGDYDEFFVAELTVHLEQHRGEYDLITAIDTLVYLGDLAPVVCGFSHALRPGGHACFTVERADESAGPGYKLNPHGRYSHTEPYLRQTLSAAGLHVLGIAGTELRLEAGTPVQGFVVVAGI